MSPVMCWSSTEAGPRSEPAAGIASATRADPVSVDPAGFGKPLTGGDLGEDALPAP
jgi:hypothetical protein